MSDFNYKGDGFYPSAEGTKESSENNKLDEENIENSVDKASEHRDFINKQQAGAAKEENFTLKYGYKFATNGTSYILGRT